MKLHFGAARPGPATLPEPAWGLSRYAFDALLLDRAILGAQVDSAWSASDLAKIGTASPPVIAAGRSITESKRGESKRGQRLFGFKTHFTGPVDDAVELFFLQRLLRRCEYGRKRTHQRVRLLGPGRLRYLKRFDFDFDRVVLESPALRDRLAPLDREMKWLSTGPLRFTQRFSPDESALSRGRCAIVCRSLHGLGITDRGQDRIASRHGCLTKPSSRRFLI